MTIAAASDAFDLEDPQLLFREEVLSDPARFYAFLRSHAPIWEIPSTSTFVVSSAELVIDAVARPSDFSSNLTSLLYRGDDGAPLVFDLTALGAATHVLATADPPTHTLHRKLLQPNLSPASVEQLEPFIRGVVDRLLDALLASGQGELVSGLAGPLPVQAICRLIGVPDGDVATLEPLVAGSNDLLAGVTDAEAMGRAAVSAGEVSAYLAALVERSQHEGAAEDSLLAVLVSAVDGSLISRDEAVGILVQLLGAGTETTTGLIASAVLRLAADASLQSRLRADPERIPGFIEEMLRYDGPFRFHYRCTTHETGLGRSKIPPNARVLLMWAAANLDDSFVADPATFDIDRKQPRNHLAFGRGLHFCIGAGLARLEARAAIERLLARTASFTLDPHRAPWYRPSIFLRRLDTLPLLMSPAPGT